MLTITTLRKLFVFSAVLFSGSVFAQYCTPTYSHTGVTEGAMSRFLLNGYGSSLIDDTLPGSSLSTGYTNRTTAVAAVTLQQGRTYIGNITYYSPLAHTGNQVWVDFNSDNVFADSELVSQVAPSVYSYSTVSAAAVNIYIPVRARTGTYRMRVRNVNFDPAFTPGYGSPVLSPCAGSDALNHYYSGVTADYSITVVALAPCSGTPVAGNATGPRDICHDRPFDISLVNDTIAGSIQYQWYSKPVSSGSFSAISGATSRYLHMNAQLSSTIYKAVITCPSGGARDSSTGLTVTQDALNACYCGLGLGGDTFKTTIDSLSIPGTTFNAYTPHNPNTYSAFADTGSVTANLAKSIPYTLFLKAGGERAYSAHMWIDYNSNGTFDIAEYTNITTRVMASGETYFTFSIPSTSDTGRLGMRIRFVDDSNTIAAPDACAYISGGQTKDFIVRVFSTGLCSGHISGTIVYATQSAVCNGVPFGVGAYGYPPVSALTFQWLSRPASTGTFTAISGATTPFYLVVSQMVSTDYKLVVSCTPSGTSDTTGVVTVGQLPVYLCQCSPTIGVGLNHVSTTAPLDSFSIAGTTLNNTPSGDPVYVSYNRSSLSVTATLERGTYYTVAANSYGAGPYNVAMWIDYDQNGTFDPGEYYSITTNHTAGSPASQMIYIPALADTGSTRLRIRSSAYGYGMSASDACTDIYYGSTQDYVINIARGIPCTGSPLAGSCNASVSSVCPGQRFAISNFGASNQLGISYQWISRRSGASAYASIVGATNLSYTVSTQSFATEYVLMVSCSYSGITDTGVSVTVNENPVYLCACSPLIGVRLNDTAILAPIDSFCMIPTTLDNYTPGSTAVYTNYPPSGAGTTGIASIGGNYVLGVNSYGSGTGNYKAGAWIDYDHDGIYASSEYILITNGVRTGTPAYTSFVLPSSSDTGFTGLRVRTYPAWYSITPSDACTEFFYGATQDYVLNLVPSIPCFGTPAAGTSMSLSPEVCAGESFQVVANGYSRGDRFRYQWMSRPIGGSTFTTISGATNPLYSSAGQTSATEYAMEATCISSGMSDTGFISQVLMKPGYLCYCSPRVGVTLNTSTGEALNDSFSIVGTAIDNYTPGDSQVYVQFYPTTSTTTDSIVQGNSYTLYVNARGTVNYDAALWIDYNQNGSFDSAEYTLLAVNSPPGVPASVVVSIPYTADTGMTGMRVRTTKHPIILSNNHACLNAGTGSTRDYVVRIAPGASCTVTPATSVAYSTLTSVCVGTGFTLNDTGFATGIGLTYQWMSRPAGSGTFTPISGATMSFLTVSSQSVSTDYVYRTTCATSGLSSNSNTVTVNQIPFYFCYCGSPLGTSYSATQISNIQIHGSTLHVTGTFATPYKVFGRVGDSTGTIQRALPYPIDLKVTGGAARNAGMWIDYNHNAAFETSEYTRLDTNIASGVQSTTSFTIPATADTGFTGMRIRTTQGTTSLRSSDACTNITNSQTFDFTIRVDTLVRCSGSPTAGSVTSSSSFACPSMPFRLDNDGYSVGSGITYQWMQRTTGSYANISGATNHSVNITGQTVTTDYVLVARCTFSGGTDTTSRTRITQNPFDSCYCSPPTGVTLVTSGGHHDILQTNVYGVTTMTVPEQSPGSSGYVALPATAYTTLLHRYYSYPIKVYANYSTYTITGMGAWVDYDHNSVFDSAEFVPLTQSSDRSNWSGTISIPYTSLLGRTGLRVIASESGTVTASTSCRTISVGQVQDHIVSIDPAPCYAISSASVINITDTSARAIWGRVTGSFGYQYVFDTFSSPPSRSGIATTDTFAQSGCLVSGHIYYLHVRDSCDNSAVSGWINIPFRTDTCRGTVTVTATGVTNTRATINWSAVAGTVGYQYLLDTTATPSASSGTAISATTVTFTTLTQGTTYYIHIRSGCPCSNFSAWRTISFTTICDTVTNLRAVTVTDTSVTLRWDSIAHISNYAYVVDTSAGAPSGSGTSVTDTTVVPGGLRPATRYYAHVRHRCSGGFSNWITISFTTTRCDTVTGLAGSATDTSVTFHWTPVTGSAGYYYVLNSIPSPPTSTTGSFTTGTTVSVGGLLSSHTYYAHVRTSCSGGVSGWITIPITTLACDTITGLSVTAICDTSAFVRWTAMAAFGYVYVIDTSATASSAGTFTSVITVNLNTLIPGTTYYVHVRHLCSVIDTSAWVTVRFTTPSCTPVSGLAASRITTSGATISWTPDVCVGGYYYVLDMSSASPSVPGTFLTSGTVTETTLSPGTLYYAHVRVYCGGGVYSSWATIPLTTLNCPATASVNIVPTSTTAQVNWVPVTGSVGYECAVDVLATPPTAGTYTVTPYYLSTGLTPSTAYYAHVRVLCIGGIYSPWVNEPFSTTGVGVQNVNGADFAMDAFPNPVTAKLTITVRGEGENGFVCITDLTGKVLVRHAMKDDKLDLDISSLASGVYMLRYQDDSHTRMMKLNKQ